MDSPSLGASLVDLRRLLIEVLPGLHSQDGDLGYSAYLQYKQYNSTYSISTYCKHSDKFFGTFQCFPLGFCLVWPKDDAQLDDCRVDFWRSLVFPLHRYLQSQLED
jgi:hypothetical protein